VNPQETLERYRNVVVVNSPRVNLELSQHLRKLPVDMQRARFGGRYGVGFFWLFSHSEVHPDKVMECVVSTAGDAISSTYLVHPMFASLGELLTARENLIKALTEKIGLSIESIGIDDPGRGRALSLPELSTGQLIDILAERMGSSIASTSSMGGDLDLVGKLSS
jgi:hypothetical protein